MDYSSAKPDINNSSGDKSLKKYVAQRLEGERKHTSSLK